MKPKKLSKARIELILNSRDNLSKGEDIPHDHAVDLVRWYADELERVVRVYQDRQFKIYEQLHNVTSNVLQSFCYPEEK